MSLIYPNVLDDSIIKDRRRRAEVLVFNALKNHNYTQLQKFTILVIGLILLAKEMLNRMANVIL